MSTLKPRFFALWASVAVHGSIIALLVTLISRDPGHSVIEIDLLAPVVVSEEVRRTAPPTKARPAAPAPTELSRTVSVPSSAGTPESEPVVESATPPAPTAPPPPVLSAPKNDAPVPAHAQPPGEPARAPVRGDAFPLFDAPAPGPLLRDASPGQGGAGGALAMLAPGQGGASSGGLDGVGRSGGQGARVLAIPSDGDRRLLPEYDRFYSLIRQRIGEHLIYPASAKRRELGGTVLLEIVLNADGTVGRVTLLRSSNHAVLDEAAIESVKRAAPFAFLSTLPARQVVVRLPIVFEIK